MIIACLAEDILFYALWVVLSVIIAGLIVHFFDRWARS